MMAKVDSSLSTIDIDSSGLTFLVGGRSVFKVMRLDEDKAELVEGASLRGGRKENLSAVPMDARFHPVDPGLIATAAPNGAVLLWRHSARERRVLGFHQATATCVCWSSHDTFKLLSGSEIGTVILWDTRPPATPAADGTAEGHSAWRCVWSRAKKVGDLAWHPTLSSIFAVGWEGGNLEIIHAERDVVVEQNADTDMVMSVAWHPVWRNVLATGGRDSTVRIWSAEAALGDLTAPATMLGAAAAVAGGGAVAHTLSGAVSATSVYRGDASGSSGGGESLPIPDGTWPPLRTLAKPMQLLIAIPGFSGVGAVRWRPGAPFHLAVVFDLEPRLLVWDISRPDMPVAAFTVPELGTQLADAAWVPPPHGLALVETLAGSSRDRVHLHGTASAAVSALLPGNAAASHAAAPRSRAATAAAASSGVGESVSKLASCIVLIASQDGVVCAQSVLDATPLWDTVATSGVCTAAQRLAAFSTHARHVRTWHGPRHDFGGDTFSSLVNLLDANKRARRVSARIERPCGSETHVLDDAFALSDCALALPVPGARELSRSSRQSTFSHLAAHYVLEGAPKAELCERNSRVAKAAGLLDAALVWESLAGMCRACQVTKDRCKSIRRKIAWSLTQASPRMARVDAPASQDLAGSTALVSTSASAAAGAARRGAGTLSNAGRGRAGNPATGVGKDKQSEALVADARNSAAAAAAAAAATAATLPSGAGPAVDVEFASVDAVLDALRVLVGSSTPTAAHVGMPTPPAADSSLQPSWLALKSAHLAWRSSAREADGLGLLERHTASTDAVTDPLATKDVASPNTTQWMFPVKSTATLASGMQGHEAAVWSAVDSLGLGFPSSMTDSISAVRPDMASEEDAAAAKRVRAISSSSHAAPAIGQPFAAQASSPSSGDVVLGGAAPSHALPASLLTTSVAAVSNAVATRRELMTLELAQCIASRRASRELRRRFVRRLLDYYAENGDVQMCVTITRVIGRQARLAAGEARLERWVDSYVELLHRAEQWGPASTIMARSRVDRMQRVNQTGTSIRVTCNLCSADIPISTQPPAIDPPVDTTDSDDNGADIGRGKSLGGDTSSVELTKPSVCGKCARVLPLCAVCELPVVGLFAWCQECGHGGHPEHMHHWFDQAHTATCPTGCGHVCNLVTQRLREPAAGRSQAVDTLTALCM